MARRRKPNPEPVIGGTLTIRPLASVGVQPALVVKVGRAKVSLREAVDKALARLPGAAVRVQLREDGGKLAWEVLVTTPGGEVRPALVDADTGRVSVVTA
ncbi:PepSY domain-containing protein [Candidatus Nitrospira bockiana]